MYRIGIDVGGTFTDLVAVDDSGEVTLVKVASTPEECRRFIQAEIEKWGKVIRDNNIRADS